MRTVKYDYKKITYPDADAPLFGTQLYVKFEPNYDDPSSPTPADGTDEQISVQIQNETPAIYNSKWFGGACWFFFDVKINGIDISESQNPTLNLFINYNSRDLDGTLNLDDTLIRLGSWIGERIQREFNGFTLFKVDAGTQSSFKNMGVDSYCWFKMQKYGVVNITLVLLNVDTVLDSVLGSFYSEYDIYYYCFTNSLTPPAEDYEGWLGGYEIKPICSTLGIEPQKSKFVWVDRYGFVHTYYFEVTSITNGKGEKVEYSKTIQDANANISYYKTSISQPKITKAFQSEDEDLKNIKDIATLGSAMYLEINGVPTDPSLISALVVPNEKGLSRLTFSVDFNVENKNVVLW